MIKNTLISAIEAFNEISKVENRSVAIDVRSPKEFAEGHFSNTFNLPILNDQHRHQIGLTYKEKGNEPAQVLGHELVSGEYQKQMIHGWCKELSNSTNPGLIFCWRGGLRSKIAQQWILDQGIEVLRVEGGYKALRHLAIDALQKVRRFIILGGPTGSGKTVLLKKTFNHVDLEGLANHRGSAFGLRLQTTQPLQSKFENDLGQALFLQKESVILEDESRLIGARHLRNELYNQMMTAPVVLLNIDINTRAKNILNEYLIEPQSKGQSSIEIHKHYQDCIRRIRNKLGGMQADQCLKLMSSAFENNETSLHLDWIKLLLESYYDQLYAYSHAKKNRKILFQGDHSSCLEFLLNESEKK